MDNQAMISDHTRLTQYAFPHNFARIRESFVLQICFKPSDILNLMSSASKISSGDRSAFSIACESIAA